MSFVAFVRTSTKPYVATISPIDEKTNNSIIVDEEDTLCSQSARVVVKLKTADEDSTVILAEEEG